MQNRQYRTARQVKITRQQCCKWYLKHIATQIVTCQCIGGTIGEKQRSVVDDIVDLTVNGVACRGEIFVSPQLHMQNVSHEQNHTPFRGDLSSLCQDLIQLCHWDMDGAPKI